MKKVCAGIVTYNPDLKLLKQCFNSIYEQVDFVYIFDNASQNASDLEYFSKYEYCSIYYSNNNVGIAKALNEMCQMAYSVGFRWILTMDQDSICSKNMVNELLKYENETSYGIICPRVEFWIGNQLLHQTKEKNELTKISACITSGSLTKLSAWKKIGGFDEWMFIDYVDNEFCIRLRIEGYYIVRVKNALLYQRAGEMKYIRLLKNKKIMLPYYSEFRNYYICRNTIYYIRKYKKFIDLKYELGIFLYSQVIKILFEKGRWKTIKSSFRGIMDGMVKKIGG